jgi:hypothetical protein
MNLELNLTHLGDAGINLNSAGINLNSAGIDLGNPGINPGDVGVDLFGVLGTLVSVRSHFRTNTSDCNAVSND